jgi:hypothetical protein
MNKWLSEFKASWRDKNFICSMLIYVVSYAIITAIGLLLPTAVFIGILGAIAGWQIASWSIELTPKVKQILFKE